MFFWLMLSYGRFSRASPFIIYKIKKYIYIFILFNNILKLFLYQENKIKILKLI